MGPWQLLILAGILEVVWAFSMKASNGFTHTGYSIVTAVAALISFWLLALAMKDLPLGTAYAVWVGIGAVGAAIFGIMWFGEGLTLFRVGGIALILLGVLSLKLSTS